MAVEGSNEYKDDSGELLRDDHDAMASDADMSGDSIAEQDQKDASGEGSGNRDTIADKDRNAAGGTSADAKAAHRAGGARTPKSDDDSAGSDPDASPQAPKQDPSSGNRITNLAKAFRGDKRALIGLGVGGGVAAVLIGVLFPLLAVYKLVHIGEDVKDFFDNRHAHAIERRIGSHYKVIFDEEGKVTGYKQKTGKPIQDAYANYNMAKLEADFARNGYAPVFDGRGKLAGFMSTPPLADGEKVQITDANIRVVDGKGNVLRTYPHNSDNYHDLSDASLKDKRAWIRTQLSDMYPDMNFFRRSKRARALDSRWGIRRKLLENLKEKVADKEADLKSKLADSIKARIMNTDGLPNSNADREKKAQDDLKTAEGREGDAAGTSAKAIVSNSAGLLVMGCAIYAIADSIHTGLMVAREGQLMRIGIATLATADQVKTGDLHTKQIGLFMGLFNKYETSGAWQRITRANPKAKVNSAKFSLTGGSAMDKISAKIVAPIKAAKVGPVAVGATVCNAVNSTAGQVVLVGVGIIQTIINLIPVADLADIAVEAGSQAGKQTIQYLVWGEVGKAIIENIVKNGSGPMLTTASSGADWIDGTIAGYDNYSNNMGRGNGGIKLTAAQVAELNYAGTNDAIDAAASKGFVYRFFNPDNNYSLTSKLAMATPTSAGSLSSSVNSVIASAMPSSYLDDVKKLVDRVSGKALAADDEEDPAGFAVPQYGMPDELSDKYPDPVANENWVYNYVKQHDNVDMQAEIGDDKSDANEGDDSYHTFVRDCLLSDDQEVVRGEKDDCKVNTEAKERFVVYRFDLGEANMLNSYNNEDDDQSPEQTAGATDGGTANGGAGDVSGSREDLYKKIIASKHTIFVPGVCATADQMKADLHDKMVLNALRMIVGVENGGFDFPITCMITGHHVDGAGDGLHNPAAAAVDVGYQGSDPTGNKLYKFVYDNRQALHVNMLIHNPAPAGTQCISGGQAVPCLPTFSDVWAAHASHIHIGVWKDDSK